jgi:predicted transcriptional regulator
LAKVAENKKPISNKMLKNSFIEAIKEIELKQVYYNTTTFINDNYSNLYFPLNGCSVFHLTIIA